MWKVLIPTGRWMQGVNRFQTKAKAVEFIDRWNQVEVTYGRPSLTFFRSDVKEFEVVS